MRKGSKERTKMAHLATLLTIMSVAASKGICQTDRATIPIGNIIKRTYFMTLDTQGLRDMIVSIERLMAESTHRQISTLSGTIVHRQ